MAEGGKAEGGGRRTEGGGKSGRLTTFQKAMNQINGFRDLRVYRSVRQQAFILFDISKSFPREERYSLTDQVRRSSRAVAALLAEAWGLREYPGAFVDKLWRALAEAKETQAWLDVALDCGYLSNPQYAKLDQSWDMIAGMLFKMIDRKDAFCNRTRRER